MMDVLTFETCWAVNSEIINEVTSSWFIFIQLVACYLRKNELNWFFWEKSSEENSDFCLLMVVMKSQEAEQNCTLRIVIIYSADLT